MQQAPEIDGLHEDFTPRSRLPYPLFADPEGFIQQQSFWQGHVYKVIGFQNHPAIQKIDLWWGDVKEASQVEGKYLVTSDESGNWGSWPTAILDAEYQERERFE
jgi:hypothetical protein